MSWVSKSNESKRSPVCPSAGRMVNSRRRSEAMMKRVMIAAVVALGLSGCATMQGLTPCEKAILAKYARSEEHTSELQSLMRTSYAVFSLKQKRLTELHSICATLDASTLNITIDHSESLQH